MYWFRILYSSRAFYLVVENLILWSSLQKLYTMVEISDDSNGQRLYTNF